MSKKTIGYKLEVDIKLKEVKEGQEYGTTLMHFDVEYPNRDYDALKRSFLNLVDESDDTEVTQLNEED